MQLLREQMEKIQQELALIRQNPGLAHAAPEMVDRLKAHVKAKVLGTIGVKEKPGSEIALVNDIF